MDLNSIKIIRTLPIVGGFIKIPHDNNNLPKVDPTEVPYSVLEIDITSRMKFIEFPEVAADSQTNVDYQKVVEDIAIAKL
jgi:hypothetical protein